MTFVEYGRLEVKMVEGKPQTIIACTAPIGILEKLSKINDVNIKLIVTKDKKVFADIPDKLFE